eukprot:CAMPEP_0170569738 /NCGR_PEP_ID=MMETSP0224-20130122/722_1 /TAXON_ID=285029 /ORGANISM="Togula jolla, Strain CCCM 725" /LENGTH=486 /DNA_ID=CAMNT_0010891939 /DNA_START=20 /DNA_END=1480 /DNA_ORIENTATION=-
MAARPEVIELIPHRLYWLPYKPLAPRGFNDCFACAETLCEARLQSGKSQGRSPGKYAVPHYSSKATGFAFGPLSLDQVLWFCRNLDARMASSTKVAIGSPPRDDEARSNTAVLIGAYLILRCGWTSGRVFNAMGADDANAQFACSWDRKGPLVQGRTLRVMDCWAGLEQARLHDWIDTSCLDSDEDTAYVVDEYLDMVHTYDASWVVPGQVMVSSDPLTTACDPNPDTFKDVFTPTSPRSPIRSKKTDLETENPSETTPRLGPGQFYTTHTGWAIGDTDVVLDNDMSPPAGMSPPSEIQSCDTVCKEYTPLSRMELPESCCPDSGSFASFLRSSGIRLVVRANFMYEAGMPQASYDAGHLVERGIRHLDLPVPDFDGGLPTGGDIARLIESCQGCATGCSGNAVAIHCKGGFGRSMVLACCLVVERYDVRGDALLGWVRIVRPGSVNTLEQERFISGLNGRGRVWKLANRGSVGSKTPCHKGCTIA